MITMANSYPALASIHEESGERTTEDSTERQLELPPAKRPRTGYGCDTCGTSYTEKRTLLRHLKTPAHCKRAGTPRVSFQCGYCSRHFSRDDLRHRHEKEVHFKIRRSTRPLWSSSARAPATTDGDSTTPSPVEFIPGDTVPSSSTSALSSLSSSDYGACLMPHADMDIKISRLTPEQATNDANMIFNGHRPEDDRSSCGADEHSEAEHYAPGDKVTPDLKNTDIEMEPPGLISDTASLRSTSTIGSIKSRLGSFTPLRRSALIRRGATPRKYGNKIPVQCVLCQGFLGSNTAEIRAHLDVHRREYENEFSCHICQIGFTNERDLKHHTISAAQGHCGFEFDHICDCQGHHPPDMFSDFLTDNDTLRFTCRIQHWEQAQLKVYLDQINQLIHGDPIPNDHDCWSIGALRDSLVSLSSIVGYQKPRSALELGEYLRNFDNRKLPFSQRISAAPSVTSGMGNSRNLAWAALLGDKEKINQMISRGLDVNADYRSPASHDRFGLVTPMEAAIVGGDVETFKLLVHHGAHVHNAIDSVLFPLSCCIIADRAEMAQVLLERGALSHESEQTKGYALADAVYHDRTDILLLMLEHGADVNVQMKFSCPLRAAAFRGHSSMMQLISAWDGNANVQGPFMKPLKDAVSRNDVDEVNALLHNKANVRATSLLTSPLKVAVSLGNLAASLLLLQQGAKPCSEPLITSSIQAAVSIGDKSMTALLLQHGGSTMPRQDLASLLDEATSRGCTGIVLQLLQYGAGAIPSYQESNNPHVAAIWGDQETMDYITDTHTSDLAGLLQYAAFHGQQNVVQSILDRGADVNSSSADLGPALLWPIARGHQELVQLFLDKGAEVNGWSRLPLFTNALGCAAYYGRWEIALLLLETGANIDALSAGLRKCCYAMLLGKE